MAVTLVRTAFTAGVGAALAAASYTTPAVNNTTTVGDELVLALGARCSGGTPTSWAVTDTAGNTWTVESYISTTSSILIAHCICTAALVSGSNTVTVTLTGAGVTMTAIGIGNLFEFSGCDDTVEASKSQANGSTTTTLTGSTFTPATTGDLAVVVHYTKDINTGIISADSGLAGTDTAQVSSGNNPACQVRVSYLVVPNTTAIVPLATQTNIIPWLVQGVFFPVTPVTPYPFGATTPTPRYR